MVSQVPLVWLFLLWLSFVDSTAKLTGLSMRVSSASLSVCEVLSPASCRSTGSLWCQVQWDDSFVSGYPPLTCNVSNRAGLVRTPNNHSDHLVVNWRLLQTCSPHVDVPHVFGLLGICHHWRSVVSFSSGWLVGCCFTIDFSLFLVPAVLISLLALPRLVFNGCVSVATLASVPHTQEPWWNGLFWAVVNFHSVSRREAETGNGSVCCLPSVFVSTVKTWKCHRDERGRFCRRLLCACV